MVYKHAHTILITVGEKS